MTVRRRVRMLVTGANDAHTSRDGLSHKRFTTSSYYSKDAARRTFRRKKRCRTCPGSFLLLSAGQPCTERLRAESERILRFQPFLADATVRKRFADQGQDILPPEQQTPEALATQQKAEIEKWWPIIKAANITSH